MKWTAVLALAAAALLGGAGPSRASLVVFLDFNDSSSLTKDSSGNGHHATNHNGVTYDSSGFSGGAARFDGVNDYLRVAVDVDIDAMPKMSWGAWVRPDASNGIRAILSDDNGGFDRNINVDRRAEGDYAAFRGGTGGGVFDSEIAPSTSAWSFVAAVYDEPANTMTFYVDGNSFTVTTNFGGTNHTFFDVGHNPSFPEFWKGRIDNVFVYDEALSASQIASIRTSGGPTVAAVPEPSTFALAAAAGALLGAGAWRRRRAGR